MRRWAFSILVIGGLACGRAPDGPRELRDVGPAEVAPGLIDLELRGVSEEHRQLASSLGEVLDEEALGNPLDDLPRTIWERLKERLRGERKDRRRQFFELRVADPQSALKALSARDDLVYAEPELQLHALFVPDDPLYPQQWHLKAAGAEQAWEIARGDGVTVAVLDTGVAPLDDLPATRVLTGFNFLTRSGARNAASDDHFHGTHVAATIAEATDNGRGGAGMAPEAKILPLKVLSAQGSGTSAGIAEAIRYAADHGAQVINLSLGGGARSQALEEAVGYAQSRGALLVAAAGNTGARGVSYPAACSGVLAVSAVGPDGSLAPYSTYGDEVGIAAPGGDKSLGEDRGVLQQTLDDAHQPAFRFLQGTSMAAPHVSGAAALVAGLGVTNPETIARVLRETAREPGESSQAKYGAGLLDAGAAVRRVTTAWGAQRMALALLGALLAIGHARKLQQLRAGESMRPAFWIALGVFAGGLAIPAPLGFGRFSWLRLLAMAPAALSVRWLVINTLGAIALSFFAWSALGPLLAAGIARLVSRSGQSSAVGLPGAIAGGLAFGQAGLLLHGAFAQPIRLPLLPPLAVSIWLGLNAAIAWWAGRALLSRKGAAA